MRKFDRKLILEDGSEYYGYGFGAEDERISTSIFKRGGALWLQTVV